MKLRCKIKRHDWQFKISTGSGWVYFRCADCNKLWEYWQSAFIDKVYIAPELLARVSK